MIRFLSVAALLLVGGTVAYAQSSGADAIKQREAAMKSMSRAGKANAAMIKGEAPFDAKKAAANFKVIEDAAIKSKGLFPDNSKTGDTEALPVVWTKKADFLARFDKLAAVAKAAQTAATSKEALAGQAKAVGGNCGGCHKVYRMKKQK